MESTVESNVLDPDPLDMLGDTIILPDAPHSNACSVVEMRVGYIDIIAVCLERDAVVSIIHRPIIE